MTFSAPDIATLQTTLTRRWHEAPPTAAGEGFDLLVQQNHLRNFLLWHEEDIARRDDIGFEPVYRAKRNIDRYNQERNNFIEAMDQAIVGEFPPAAPGVPRNSETPGMMIDRLSILALKEFHMHEEAVRADASEQHRSACGQKLARIRVQRSDLVGCLDELFKDLRAGRRAFSVYFQFKMYNDPALNPQLYRRPASG